MGFGSGGWGMIAKGASSMVGGFIKTRGARKASQKQIDAAQEGIGEKEKRLKEIRDLLSPYVEGGLDAFSARLGLSGAGTAEQEAEQINRIKESPIFKSLQQQGTDAILQNAAATGGLRGGSTQSALAQFTPMLLQQEIQRRYSNLGGLSQAGLQSALAQSGAIERTGGDITALIQDIGAFRAGEKLAYYDELYKQNKEAGKAVSQYLGGMGGGGGSFGSMFGG